MKQAILDLSTWEIPEYKEFDYLTEEVEERIERFYSRKGVRLPAIDKENLKKLIDEYLRNRKNYSSKRELLKLLGKKYNYCLDSIAKILKQLGLEKLEVVVK